MPETSMTTSQLRARHIYEQITITTGIARLFVYQHVVKVGYSKDLCSMEQEQGIDLTTSTTPLDWLVTVGCSDVWKAAGCLQPSQRELRGRIN